MIELVIAAHGLAQVKKLALVLPQDGSLRQQQRKKRLHFFKKDL
jgi:hypothetical protein